MFRQLAAAVALALAALVVAQTAMAIDPVTYEGMVIAAGGGKLSMRDKGGKESSYTVGTDAKITVNGQAGKLEDLKAGTPVRVTSDGTVVLAVTTIDEKK